MKGDEFTPEIRSLRILDKISEKHYVLRSCVIFNTVPKYVFFNSAKSP